MTWVGRDLKDDPVPNLLLWADYHPPAQAAQDLIQPDLQHLQGWGIHSFSGQSMPVPHHSVKNLPLTTHVSLPSFTLEPFPHFPSQSDYVESRFLYHSQYSLLFEQLVSWVNTFFSFLIVGNYYDISVHHW